jgi:hypothetical protein
MKSASIFCPAAEKCWSSANRLVCCASAARRWATVDVGVVELTHHWAQPVCDPTTVQMQAEPVLTPVPGDVVDHLLHG